MFKKSIILICVCLIFSLFLGTTGAYLNQKTNDKENIITIGKINTDLSEPEWEELTDDDKILTPGKIVTKDPTVTNLGTSTNSCYAFLKLTIPKAEVRLYEFQEDGTSIISNDGNPILTDLFTYELNNGWVLIESDSNNDESTYIYGYEIPIKPGESSVPLFNEIQYVNVIEGDIPIGTKLTIPIVMISIQSDYLEGVNNINDAWDAYKEVK